MLDVLQHPLFAVAKEVAFAPVTGHSLVELTVRRLLDVISLGVVEVGEMLPSEPELADRLEVSSATLREALAVLRQAGLLTTKRGRGGGTLVIRGVSPPPAPEARRRLATRSVDELRDLGDYRLAISGHAAALAAERASLREVELLQGLATTMTKTDSLATYRRADAQMHIGIASAARSARLTSGETTVHAELGEYMSLVVAPAARLRLAGDQHRAILEAIRVRDVRGARGAAEEHARTTTAILVEARSEIADAEAERTVDYFSGIRPYGSELGSMPVGVPFEEPARADAPPKPPARSRRPKSR